MSIVPPINGLEGSVEPPSYFCLGDPQLIQDRPKFLVGHLAQYP